MATEPTDGAATARVTELWHYPVKSMQGITVDRLSATDQGFGLDRQYAVIDAVTARVLSAKTVRALLDADVRVGADGAVVIAAPGCDPVSVLDPGVDAALSAWLDRPVLVRERTHSDHGGYDMTFDPPDDDAEQYEIPMPEGSFFDLATVHLLSTASVAAARDARPDIDWDVRRFRPNVVVDAGEEPFVEDAWVGRTVRLGEVTVSVQQPTVRCAMPLRAQPGLDRAVDVYRTLDTLHANHLGVYGAILGAGEVRVGDELGV